MANPLGKKLLQISKPARYIGGEYGAYNKLWDEVAVRWALAFPDVYEIGMSHLGLQLLYSILNQHGDVLADRIYAPWPDMEELLKKENAKLWGVESGRPLSDFDLVGITIPYELTYTNIVSILDLGGVPPMAVARKGDDPIIIGGGCGAFNPEPVADFFDAILIGDGEEAVSEISNIIKEAKLASLTRNEKLERLSEINGLYIPSLGTDRTIRRRTLSDISNTILPENPVVPNIQLVHDRVGVEIQRGCTRGCRFCQAGMVYRPDRQRSEEMITDYASSRVAKTGYEECAFLSLSAGDYEPLPDMVVKLDQTFGDQWVHMALPSLRAESLSEPVIKALSRSLKGGFTLAPEAATDRLRRVINKGNSREDLLESVERIFSSGWKNLKLYFMIGLPTETDDDVDAIADLANEAVKIGRKTHKYPNITVNISTFIPKSHTPFQWEEQLSLEETRRRQGRLRDRVRGPGLKLKFHDAKMSLLEGIFARGGRELSKVVLDAHKAGARFDAWDDHMKFDLWMEILGKHNIDPANYLRERGEEEQLPWDHLFKDLKKEFLLEERKRSREEALTSDCSRTQCVGCGVCDFKEVKPYIVKKSSTIQTDKTSDHPNTSIIKYNIEYSKKDEAAFIGHLDFMNVWRRSLRRAGLPLAYSQGYNPRPKISMTMASSLGIEIESDWIEFELTCDIQAESIHERVSKVLPRGVAVKRVLKMNAEDPAINHRIGETIYRVNLSSFEDIREKVEAFYAANTVKITKAAKRGPREVDLKESVISLAYHPDRMLEISLKRDAGVNVFDILKYLLDLSDTELRQLAVTKEQKCQTN